MRPIRFLWLPAVIALLGMQFALAQSYPSRPVRVIVPFTPGSGTDILARLIDPLPAYFFAGVW